LSKKNQYCKQYVGEAWDTEKLHKVADANNMGDHWMDCFDFCNEYGGYFAIFYDSSWTSYINGNGYTINNKSSTSCQCILRSDVYDTISVCIDNITIQIQKSFLLEYKI